MIQSKMTLKKFKEMVIKDLNYIYNLNQKEIGKQRMVYWEGKFDCLQGILYSLDPQININDILIKENK